MDFNFTPTDAAPAAKTPYYEDARADYAPYYASDKNIETAKKEVAVEMQKLHALPLAFREGYFGNNPRRYGYEIEFLLYERRGVLRVAGLPMWRPSGAKKKRVLVQALLNVRDWLKAAVTQPIFQPTAGHPLLVHMLVDGRRTVADYIVQSGQLPQLGAGDVVDGVFSEE